MVIGHQIIAAAKADEGAGAPPYLHDSGGGPTDKIGPCTHIAQTVELAVQGSRGQGRAGSGSGQGHEQDRPVKKR